MLQSIHVIIPFKAREGKSRLSSALKPAERRLFAFAMLRDVLAAVFGQGRTTILSRQEFRAEELGIDVEILQSELELNDALNSLISHQADLDWPADILIVMADLPLLREKEIRGILSCQGDVVLCPGRGGGTNMILIRSPKFRTCYHGLSFPE
ncbi:MAG TPA: 2-phospho-L-lactate guanylyltransferase, partial [Methanothrix soehngenii]|nr:2-phospho-L-lactate guanylyltransferase [Methanothrix soehngenii]